MIITTLNVRLLISALAILFLCGVIIHRPEGWFIKEFLLESDIVVQMEIKMHPNSELKFNDLISAYKKNRSEIRKNIPYPLWDLLISNDSDVKNIIKIGDRQLYINGNIFRIDGMGSKICIDGKTSAQKHIIYYHKSHLETFIGIGPCRRRDLQPIALSPNSSFESSGDTNVPGTQQ